MEQCPQPVGADAGHRLLLGPGAALDAIGGGFELGFGARQDGDGGEKAQGLARRCDRGRAHVAAGDAIKQLGELAGVGCFEGRHARQRDGAHVASHRIARIELDRFSGDGRLDEDDTLGGIERGEGIGEGAAKGTVGIDRLVLARRRSEAETRRHQAGDYRVSRGAHSE